MAQIISGVTPQEVNFAYLAGHDRGSALVKDQERLNLQRQQLEFEQMTEMRRAAAEQQREEARSQKLLNDQAQMGDAQAMQELALSVQAGADPSAKVMKTMFGTLSRITEPGARRMAVESFGKVLEEAEKNQQMGAAEQAIERAGKDGLVDPEQYSERLKSGEHPQDITKELGDLETKRTLETMATGKAGTAIEQATALLQASPPGSPEFLEAEAIITQYANSPTDQSKPGSDQDMLLKVKKALIESDASKGRRAKEAYALHERRSKSNTTMPEEAFEGDRGGGMFHGVPVPRTEYQQPPGLKSDVKRAKAEKEKRFGAASGRAESPKSSKQMPKWEPEEIGPLGVELMNEDPDEGAIAQKLEELGVELTPENLEAVKKAVDQERARLTSGGGASRKKGKRAGKDAAQR